MTSHNTPEEHHPNTVAPQAAPHVFPVPHRGHVPSNIVRGTQRRAAWPGSAVPVLGTRRSGRLSQLYVAAHLDVLGTAPSPEDSHHDVSHTPSHAVHRVVVVGLGLSTTLILIGIGLGILGSQPFSSTDVPFAARLDHGRALASSDFFALGILVLIATPILRVIGWLVLFAHAREWRFVGLSVAMLLMVIMSIVFGAVNP